MSEVLSHQYNRNCHVDNIKNIKMYLSEGPIRNFDQPLIQDSWSQ